MVIVVKFEIDIFGSEAGGAKVGLVRLLDCNSLGEEDSSYSDPLAFGGKIGKSFLKL